MAEIRQNGTRVELVSDSDDPQIAFGKGIVSPSDSATDLVFYAGGVERARIAKDGTATGAFAAGGQSAPTATLTASGDTTGVTDRAAWDSAHSKLVSAGGGRLFLKEGTYYGRFYVSQANVTVTGAGRYTTTLVLPANTGIGQVLTVVADKVRVEHLGLDGNKTNQPVDPNPVVNLRECDCIGIYSNDVTISDCFVTRSQGHGIICWDEATSGHLGAPNATASAGQRFRTIVAGNRLDDCSVTGNSRASIDFATNNAARDSLIANNVITNGYEAITLHGGSCVTVIGNLCYNCTQGGVTVHTDGTDIAIVGNFIRECFPGIGINQDNRVSVTGNVIQCLTSGNSEGINIDVGASSVFSSDLTITGNVIRLSDSSARAFYVEGNPTRALIEGNMIYVSGGSNACFMLLDSSAAPTKFIVRNNYASAVKIIRATGGASAAGVLVENMEGTHADGTGTNKTDGHGTTTIADGNSTVTVTHGLHAAPGTVWLQTTDSEAVWPSAIGATTFVVNRSGTTGALSVYWNAKDGWAAEA